MKTIPSLYEQFKNTPKKLKIVCDWDEVIQPCEPYAFWKTNKDKNKDFDWEFKRYFGEFWDLPFLPIEYSPYGSKIIEDDDLLFILRQQTNKNSPNFYQEAPFLTIAEDLLKLIREDKVERLIFLSAYDKRKFPNGDLRKLEIFALTFALLGKHIKINNDKEQLMEGGTGSRNVSKIKLQLIGFDSETQGQSKAEWIDNNASGFDLIIDDNPNICNQLEGIDKKRTKEFDECKGCHIETKLRKSTCENECKEEGNKYVNWCGKCLGLIPIVTAPYYPAVEKKHTESVLLVKNEVSDLKKEDFYMNNRELLFNLIKKLESGEIKFFFIDEKVNESGKRECLLESLGVKIVKVGEVEEVGVDKTLFSKEYDGEWNKEFKENFYKEKVKENWN